MNITFPSNTKETIDEIRNTIGREITIYVEVSGEACSQCSLDPTTNLSTDPFCETCDGNYWINTISAYPVLAHVRWFSSEQPLWSEGGKVHEGDCQATVGLSGYNLTAVRNSDHYEVDAKEMYMKNYAIKGVPEPNRITVTLLEDKG
jgi:hypothetical protein